MKHNEIMPAYQPARTSRQHRANPPVRILLVDDDIYDRQLSSEILVRWGYEVDGAEDGAAGWEALQTKHYNLLITDNSMPKVTGVELLKKIHAARLALPVIMATGVLPETEFTRSPWLQPAATLLKPYAASALLETVEKVLRATDSLSGQIWESPPPTEGWQL